MSVEALMEQRKVVWQEDLPTLTMPVNELINERAILSQTIRFAGSVLVEQEVDFISNEQPIRSLMDALRLASNDDEAATALVRNNVTTDLMERTIKAGFISESRMEIDDAGHLMQHNQSYQAVQANSLRYVTNPVMRERTWAETKNCFRIEQLLATKMLDQYSFVVFSLAEKDMPEHFFAETKTLAIQVSRQEGDQLITQTAFVAGKDESGVEHDVSTVGQMIDYFSEIYRPEVLPEQTNEVTRGKSNAEILDQPWLIHNSLLSNGALDLVKLYDSLAGGTFYGQKQPTRDYKAHQKECQERTQHYSSATEAITRQLISEADQLDSPLKAAKRLDQLSRSYSLNLAVFNSWIDPQVFGSVSANYIAQARAATLANDHVQFNKAFSGALRNDSSSSCPGGVSSRMFGLDQTPNSLSSSFSSNDKQEDKYGPLSFTCSKGHLNHRPKNHLIDRCRVCKISVKCD